jgi:hypothetical protein
VFHYPACLCLIILLVFYVVHVISIFSGLIYVCYYFYLHSLAIIMFYFYLTSRLRITTLTSLTRILAFNKPHPHPRIQNAARIPAFRTPPASPHSERHPHPRI